MGGMKRIATGAAILFGVFALTACDPTDISQMIPTPPAQEAPATTTAPTTPPRPDWCRHARWRGTKSGAWVCVSSDGTALYAPPAP